MTELQTLCAQVAVRHRGAGHLRLQLPPELCREAVARYLVQGLERLPGVRRVSLEPDSRKLAIHYQELELSDRGIALHLAQRLRLLVERRPAPPPTPPVHQKGGLRARLLALAPVQTALDRITLWRARAAAAKVLLGRQMETRPALQVFGRDPETAAINFINEIVTFYLIKAHWTQITQLWLRQPFRYYKEWLTLSYFVFLLVRSRRHDG